MASGSNTPTTSVEKGEKVLFLTKSGELSLAKVGQIIPLFKVNGKQKESVKVQKPDGGFVFLNKHTTFLKLEKFCRFEIKYMSDRTSF